MKNTLWIFLSIILLASCKQNNKRSLLPAVKGGLGEIVVVMENAYRESALDLFIDSVFKADYAGLPQSEPLFDLFKVPPHGFSETFQVHRNIISLKIDSKLKKTELKFKKDIWAKPQLYVQLSAPNADSCLVYLRKEYPKVLGFFHQAERKRIEETHLKYINKPAVSYIRDSFNIDLKIPKTMQISMKNTNFCWFSFSTAKKEKALLVYSVPYTSPEQLSKDSLIVMRDSVLGKFVTSETSNSYMQTETRLPIHYNAGENINGSYSAELRGLWMMKSDFMGGPFVSYTVVDTIRNQLVTVEGFVYAPNKKKRNDIRRLEATLKTAKVLPLEKEEEEQ